LVFIVCTAVGKRKENAIAPADTTGLGDDVIQTNVWRPMNVDKLKASLFLSLLNKNG